MVFDVAREGRRERKARETRRGILLAALELFSERGVDAVTVEEIADRADVARGTVFNHFTSKDSLCQSLGELQLEALQEAVASGRIHGSCAGEKIFQALRLMSEFPGRNPESTRAILVRVLAGMKPGELPEHRRQVWAMFENWVSEGQQNGEFRADLPACELTGFILGLQFQAMVRWAYGLVPGSLGDYESRVLDLAIEGIRSRKETGNGGSDAAGARSLAAG